jgi:hypothetical protein
MKIDCVKCRFRKFCKVAGDPWDLKHGGDEKGWCPIAQDAVDGKGTGREIAFSYLHLSQSGENNLMSKPMNWEHPICNAPGTMAEKIRTLIANRYSDQEIMETLRCSERYIRRIKAELRNTKKA